MAMLLLSSYCSPYHVHIIFITIINGGSWEHDLKRIALTTANTDDAMDVIHYQ